MLMDRPKQRRRAWLMIYVKVAMLPLGVLYVVLFLFGYRYIGNAALVIILVLMCLHGLLALWAIRQDERP
jgi:protein-S-isoprenylcysteine O-methyltransferase Ste14